MTDLKVLQSTAVNKTHFNQSLEWNKLTSVNQNISHYIIKYGLSSVVNSYDSEGVNSTTSTTNSTALTLLLPTSPTTYHVWVAAVSGESVTGEYSEVFKINYTGNMWSIHLYSDLQILKSQWLHPLNYIFVYIPIHKQLTLKVCTFFPIIQHPGGQ